MITALIWLGAVAAYFVLGFVLARLTLPSMIRAATYHEGDGYWADNYYYNRWAVRQEDGIDRDQVQGQTRNMILVWPVYLWFYLIRLSTDRMLDRHDPEVYESQRRRIAELERDLDIRGEQS